MVEVNLYDKEREDDILDEELNIKLDSLDFNIDEYIEKVKKKYKQENIEFDVIIVPKGNKSSIFIAKIGKYQYKSLNSLLQTQLVEGLMLYILIE